MCWSNNVAFIFLCLLLVSCSSKNNFEIQTDSVSFESIATDNIVVKDLRENVHQDKFLDIGFDFGAAELHPELDENYILKFVSSLFSENSPSKNLLSLEVLSARQNHFFTLFKEYGLAQVRIRAKFKDTVTGETKTSESNCYSILEGGGLLSRQEITGEFPKALDCAMKKSLINLATNQAGDVRTSSQPVGFIPEFFTEYQGVAAAPRMPVRAYSEEGQEGENSSLIHDTWTSHSNWKARLYYLRAIDNVELEQDSAGATLSYNYLKGRTTNPKVLSYWIPAGEVELALTGEAIASAPIDRPNRSDWSIHKRVVLNVEKGKEYYIKGRVDIEGSDIWIEDIDGNVLTK